MSGLFKSRKSTTTLDPMLTPEQQAAQKILMQLGQTGSYGDLNLGDAYTGSLGDFSQSNIENISGNKLLELLQSGTSEGLNKARSTFTDLANTKFNPDDPSSGYAAYTRQVARANQEGMDAVNRDAAVTGDRFSSRLGLQKRDLAERQSDILATKLADLYNTAQNRALAGAQGLTGLENTIENINQNRIDAGFQYGGLERLLKNAEAQAKYNEFIRQRTEKLGRIDALQGVFNRNVSFGNMSTTTKAPSIFSQVLGTFDPLVGAYNTAAYGEKQAPGQASFSDLVKIGMSFAGL